MPSSVLGLGRLGLRGISTSRLQDLLPPRLCRTSSIPCCLASLLSQLWVLCWEEHPTEQSSWCRRTYWDMDIPVPR